ncbi:hypothetical protein AB0D13_32625 [Streptomyces sp. NPDC048430]|uniref:hypothetical protein n=1 Tax=Streptomyces sp. NPDC048430 TaxID=3155388 RepID=UPI00343F0DD1
MYSCELSVAGAYDLTVAGVHTYHVLARVTPVLVHNSRLCEPEAVNIANHAAQRATAGDGSHYV